MGNLDANELIKMLKSEASKSVIASQARFGINTEYAIGVTVPKIRKIAKLAGTDHNVAQELWNSKIHEARILACMVDDPKLVTESQMERWVKEINSWDLCDSCCGTLFDKTSYGYAKALEWARRPDEYIKRAGFVLMAYISVHDRVMDDDKITRFIPVIEKESWDDRNFVRKAVNWALREVGKRNARLNRLAIESAERIKMQDSRSARWIASDALRELRSEAVQKRLPKKE